MRVRVGSFPQPPIGASPLVVEGNTELGFPGPWKSQGSAGALDRFLGGFSGKALLLSYVCVYLHVLSPQ